MFHLDLFSGPKPGLYGSSRLYNRIESFAVFEIESTSKSTAIVVWTIATTFQASKRQAGHSTERRRWQGNASYMQMINYFLDFQNDFFKFYILFFQPLVNFGVQKKEREEKTAELMKEKGPIWKLDSNDDDVASLSTNGVNGSNGTKNGENPAPALKDIIGTSLKYVGTYKKLDNTKQVVALIDDVILA